MKNKNQVYNNYAGLMANVMVGCTALLSNYVKRNGGGDFHMALITSLPALVAMIGLLPGAFLIDHAQNKYKVSALFGALSRLFIFGFALVPFFPQEYRATLLILLIGFRHLPESIWGSGYQSCMADAFDKKDLAKAMASRNTYCNVTNMITVYAVSQIMAWFALQNFDPILAFQLVFVIGAIGGLIEIYFFMQIKPIAYHKNKDNKLFKELKYVFKTLFQQKQYILYCAIVLFFYVSWMYAQPLFSIYALDVLGANETWMSYVSFVTLTSSVVSMFFWPKLIQKYGNAYCLAIAIIGMAVTPFTYTISQTIQQMTLLQVIPGIATAGVNLILFNMLIEVTPTHNRTLYISIYSMGVQFITFLTPLIAVSILPIFGINTLLNISGILRLLAGIILILSAKKIYTLINSES